MATLASKGYLNLKATHFSGGSRPTDKGGVGGGGAGGHPDPDIREGGGLQKNFFRFGLKIRGGGGSLGPALP